MARGSTAKVELSGSASLHLRVGEAERLAGGEGDDLFEAFPEVEFERLPIGPAEMRHAQNIRHLEERVVSANDRLVLVDIDRRRAGTAGLQGGE